MKRIFSIALLLLAVAGQTFAQNSIRVEAPNVVAVNEQFNVTFIIEGEKNPSDFTWSEGDDFQLVWGPQKGTSSSVQIINGKRSSSHQTTFTYILIPKSTGVFQIPTATAQVGGEKIASNSASVQVVTDASSSNSGSASQSSGQQPSGGSQEPSSSTSADIAGGDLFLRLSLSRSDLVIGEPVTATLKLYQRVNIAGFENAKFPSFNGFWSQETYSPTNIEFKRESLDDKIYNSAVLRTYVLIPQQAGTITIDPAELVCLVNVRAGNRNSNSVFDSFFQDEYKTIRKRVTTSAVKVRVSPLPSGQPASFGGGVGSFGISARLTSDELKTHDAASLVITVTGRGNVALLEEPKVSFPPDFEVYDTKTTENTDKSAGGISGSKSFEYPFIPRSHGDFTIGPVEYSYYDIASGKYVTLHTEPMRVKVAKGKASDSSVGTVVSAGVERKDVRSLADDIRFISTKTPSFSKGGSFFLGSPLFIILLILILCGAVVWFFSFRKVAAMRADVAGAKNRMAVKMARKRLKVAGDYLSKNLYTPFYEELHKALIGFISDKLNMDMSEISKENISSALTDRGVAEDLTKSFVGLLDECEFARYSSDTVQGAMEKHYEQAVSVISSIDSSLKGGKSSVKSKTSSLTVIIVLLAAGLCAGFPSRAASAQTGDSLLTLSTVSSADSLGISPVSSDSLRTVRPEAVSADTPFDSLWSAGVSAYSDSRFKDASDIWSLIVSNGSESPVLYYNIGDAFFKQGNYPKAILNYERALKLDPSYSDARYNLEFANQFVQDKIEPVPEFILKSFARKVSYLLSSNVWAGMFLFLLALALAMEVMFLLSSSVGKRRTGFYCAIVLFILSLCALGCSYWQKTDYKRSDSAIVMAPVSSVKSSPSADSAKDLFIVHEGAKVTVKDEVGDWKNISLADGRQGWIPSEDLEVI